MNRTFYQKILSSSFVLLFIGFFSWYIATNYEQLLLLFELSFTQAFLIIFLVICVVIIRGLLNTYFYRHLEMPLSLFEGFGLAVLNILGNILPFSGGLVAKGIYLKKRYHLQYSRYFSATASLSVCFIAVNGIVSLLSMLCLFLLHYEVPVFLVAGFILMAITIILVWVPINLNLVPTRFHSHLNHIQIGWSLLSKQPYLLIFIIVLQILTLFVVALRLLLIYAVFSIDINIFLCLILSGAIVLTSIVNIIPGGICVREGILGGISYLMGYSFGISAIVVAFDRVCGIFVVSIMGIIFSAIAKKQGL